MNICVCVYIYVPVASLLAPYLSCLPSSPSPSAASFSHKNKHKTNTPKHSKAAHPDRVYAGVVQQNDQGDSDCLYSYCAMIKEELKIEPQVAATDRPVRVLENCPHAEQVKMLRVQSAEAKGPTYGRYLGSKFAGGGEFCMQIDAHMDFEDEWDNRLMDMWGEYFFNFCCVLCV